MPAAEGGKIGRQQEPQRASHERHDEAPREEWVFEMRILFKLGWEEKRQWKPAQKTEHHSSHHEEALTQKHLLPTCLEKQVENFVPGSNVSDSLKIAAFQALDLGLNL